MHLRISTPSLTTLVLMMCGLVTLGATSGCASEDSTGAADTAIPVDAAAGDGALADSPSEIPDSGEPGADGGAADLPAAAVSDAGDPGVGLSDDGGSDATSGQDATLPEIRNHGFAFGLSTHISPSHADRRRQQLELNRRRRWRILLFSRRRFGGSPRYQPGSRTTDSHEPTSRHGTPLDHRLRR